MAKEVARSGGQPDPLHMRAADADRQKIADQLKAALDEGRLSLHEYDDRVSEAYAARTYADLLGLVTDLPTPGLSAEEVSARRQAELRREARKLPMALMVLWTIWAAAGRGQPDGLGAGRHRPWTARSTSGRSGCWCRAPPSGRSPSACRRCAAAGRSDHRRGGGDQDRCTF